MKSLKIFKYIFIIFVIILVAFAIYTIYNKKDETNSDSNSTSNTISSSSNYLTDIRLGITNYDTINPLITSNQNVLYIDNLIFEPLYTITSDYKLEPCLAKECSNIGNNTYVIKIDTNINWQDGTSLISKDIQYTIDLLKQNKSVYSNNVEHITSTEIVDSSTIKIIVDGEIPFFEYNLTFPIVSSSYYFDDDFFSSSKTPMGTGMFKISDISSNSITLVKNEKWRNIGQENSKIETIKVNLYTSKGEEFNSFKIGNIDILNTRNANFTNYVGTIGFNEKDYAGREFDFLSFNCKDTILSNKEVRQAINYAIDKENIISAVFNNQYLKANYPLDYGNFLYTVDDNSSGYNAEQAKTILENAGWTYTNNRWTKNISGTNQRLKLTLSVQSSNATRMQVAEVIKEQLSSIGIEVTIKKISDDAYNNSIQNKDYQMILTGVFNSYSPDLSYYFGSGNVCNYENNDITALINTAENITDTYQLKEKYQKIYNIYQTEVPFVGLYRNKEIVITSQNLVGDVKPNNYYLYYNISEWYRK